MPHISNKFYTKVTIISNTNDWFRSYTRAKLGKVQSNWEPIVLEQSEFEMHRHSSVLIDYVFINPLCTNSEPNLSTQWKAKE